MKFAVFLVLITFGVAPGIALGHAYLETSDPATGATLQAAPEEVTLTFSEPLELRFSTFKVAPLETDATDPREIKLAAQDLKAEVLGDEGHHGDEPSDISETGAQPAMNVEVLTNGRMAREVTLGVGDLSPGTYVVMWRLLSADTHASDDFITFTVAP